MTLVRIGSEETLQGLARLHERMLKRRGKPLGYSTGFPVLDAPIGGLIQGETTILAARPGMGKSALAVSIARNMTRELVRDGKADRYAACVFSLEMSTESILTREAIGDSQISAERYRTGNATPQELERFRLAAEALSPEPLYVDDTSGANAQHITTALSELMERGVQPVLVVIDHVGLMAESGKDMYERATRASNALRPIAQLANAPLLALAQLNRQVEQREDKRPTLSDLRETGAHEQNAFNVLMLYRHSYYFPFGHPGHDPQRADVAEVFVAKARNGEANRTVKLRFIGERTRFEAL